jgi:hypothetical protein
MALLGCSGGADPVETTFGPGPWQLPGSSGDDEPVTGQATEATTGGADGSGSGSGGPVTTVDPSTSGPPPMGSSSDGEPPGSEGTFGGGNDAGMQPDSGWWAHCIPSSIACDAGFACLSTDAGSDGVCTTTCNPAGDASSCGASPGGTTEPICLTVGGDSVCALSCEGGLTCPGGMLCINESDDLGPISICI